MKKLVVFMTLCSVFSMVTFVSCEFAQFLDDGGNYQSANYLTVNYESPYGEVPQSFKALSLFANYSTIELPVLSEINIDGNDLVFDGWYDGEIKVDKNSGEIKNSLTLSAKWKLNVGFNGDITCGTTPITPAYAGAGTVEVFSTSESIGGSFTGKHRIPTLLSIVNDRDPNGILVALADRRTGGDLNGTTNRIEVMAKHSTDLGKTWSDPVRVSGISTSGKDAMGDAAAVYNKRTQEIVALAVAYNGLFEGNANQPQKIFMMKSKDNGRSWGDPIDISHFLFGPTCLDPVRSKVYAGFVGSGNGLQMANGRLIFALAVRTTPTTAQGKQSGQTVNWAMYSDDDGTTWQVSENSPTDNWETPGQSGLRGYGDEAKIVELPDGTLMMLIRPCGPAGYHWKKMYSHSYDGGVTWTPAKPHPYLPASASNGDVAMYCSKNNGWSHDILIAAHDTQSYDGSDNGASKLVGYSGGSGSPGRPAFFYSTDNGKTFKGRVWYNGASAYSSFAVLPDGSIGVLVEHGGAWAAGYINFFRTNIEWITNGEITPTKVTN